MAIGPIATAYVTVEGDADAAGREIESDLRNAFTRINALLRNAGTGAFDELTAEARDSALDVARLFAQSAAKINQELEAGTEGAFSELDDESRVAVTRMTENFTFAARRIALTLDEIGEHSFDDLGADALQGGEAVVNALRSAALAARHALEAIELPTEKLVAEAEVLRARLAATLRSDDVEVGLDEDRLNAELLAARARIEALLTDIDADIRLGDDRLVPAALKARATLEAELRDIDVHLDLKNAADEAAAAKATLESFLGDIQVGIDLDRARATLASLGSFDVDVDIAQGAARAKATLESFGPIDLDVELDMAKARATLASMGAVDIDIDIQMAEEAAKAKAALEAALADVDVKIDLKGIEKEAAKARAQLDAALSKVGSGRSAFGALAGTLTRALTTALVFGIGAGSVAFVALGIKASAEFERIGIALQNIIATKLRIGFEEAAPALAALENQIRGLALRTPFQFIGLAENVQQLLAAGSSLEEVMGEVEALGSAGAFFGVEPNDLQFVIRALAQMRGSTRPLQQDINQIIQRLPGFAARSELAFRVGAREAGIFGDKLEELRAQGLGTTEALRLIAIGEEQLGDKAVSGAEGADILLEAMGKIPGAAEALERQAKSLTGQLERLKEATQFGLATAFKPFNTFLTQGDFDEATGRVDSFLSELSDAVQVGLQDMGRGVAEAFTDGVEGVDGEGLARSLLGFFEAVVPTIGNLFRQVAVVVDPIIDTLTEFFQAEGSDLEETLDDIARSLGELASVSLSGLLTTFDALLPLVSTVLDALAALPDEFIQIIAIAALFKNNVVRAFTAVRGAIEAVAKVQLATGVAQAVTGIGDEAVKATTKVGGLTAVLKGIPALLGTLSASPQALLGLGALFVGGVFLKAMSDARAEAAEFKKEVDEIEKSLTEAFEAGENLTNALREPLKPQLFEDLGEGSVEGLERMGILVEDIISDIDSGVEPVERLQAAMEGFGLTLTEIGDSFRLDVIARDDNGLLKNRGDLLREMEEQTGLTQTQVANIADDIVEAAEKAELAAFGTLQGLVQGGLFSQEEIDDAVDEFGGALQAVQELAEETERRLADISFADAIERDLGDAQKLLDDFSTSLEELRFPTAMAEVSDLGLEPQVQQMQDFIKSFGGGLPGAEQLTEFMRGMGTDLGDAEVIFAAVIESYQADIERLNGILEQLNPQALAVPIKEFGDSMRSAFVTIGEDGSVSIESAKDAILANLGTLVDEIGKEAANVETLLTAPIAKSLSGLRDTIVKSLQGTPEGRQVLGELVSEGDIAAFVADFNAKLVELSEILQVDIVGAFNAGTVSLNDILQFEDTPEGRQELIDAVVNSATTAVEEARRQVESSSIQEKILHPWRFNPTDEQLEGLSGAGGTDTGAPADIVNQELGPVRESAQTAGTAAGEGFVSSFSTAISEGFEGASGSIATAAASAINLAMAGVANSLVIAGFGLAVNIASIFGNLGTAAGQAFGIGASAAIVAVFVGLGTLIGAASQKLGQTLVLGLVASILGSVGAVLGAAAALGATLAVGLSLGVTRAIAAANKALTAGFSQLTATTVAAATKMAFAFSLTFAAAGSSGVSGAIATVTAVAVVGMTVMGITAAAALGAALSTGIAMVRAVVVGAIAGLTAIMALMLVTGSITAAAQGTAALAAGLIPMAAVAAAAGSRAGAAFALALATSLVTGTYAAAGAAAGAMNAAMAGIAGAAASQGRQAGLAFGVGLAAGIRASAYLAAAAAASAVFAAVAASRAAFRIGSPSKVGIEIGNRFGEGLAIGIEGLIGDVRDASTRLSVAAIRSLDSLSAAKLSAGSFSVQGTRSQRVQQVEIVGGMPRVITEPQQTFNFPLNVPVPDPEKIAFALGPQVARRVNHGGFVDV